MSQVFASRFILFYDQFNWYTDILSMFVVVIFQACVINQCKLVLFDHWIQLELSAQDLADLIMVIIFNVEQVT